jgi:F-type H+-transporting ATPase subunit O
VLVLAAAEPLDKSTLDRLRKTLESSKTVKEYKTLKIHNRVQADLLGGLVVDFGDEKSVDLSVKSRVQKLEQLITRKF